MKIVSDHGFPKDGSMPDSDPFDLFKNERDYIAQSGRMKTTVAAMDWAAGEIDRLRSLAFKYLQEIGVQATTGGESPPAGWQPIETAPKDRDYFILLWCPEDTSRWLAKWQGNRWYGVDDFGLAREGASVGDPNVVTGWFVSHWMPLPTSPIPEERKEK